MKRCLTSRSRGLTISFHSGNLKDEVMNVSGAHRRNHLLIKPSRNQCTSTQAHFDDDTSDFTCEKAS